MVIRRFFLLTVLCGVLLFPTHAFCGSEQSEKHISIPKRSDLVFQAKPIRVRNLKAGSKVDAIEKSPEDFADAKKIVLFNIEKVTKGSLPKVKAGGPSEWEQVKKAAHDKEYMKLLTLDINDPNKKIQEGWFSVAVADPAVTFGIKEGEPMDQMHFKLYLAKMKGTQKSFILLKTERLKSK